MFALRPADVARRSVPPRQRRNEACMQRRCAREGRRSKRRAGKGDTAKNSPYHCRAKRAARERPPAMRSTCGQKPNPGGHAYRMDGANLTSEATKKIGSPLGGRRPLGGIYEVGALLALADSDRRARTSSHRRVRPACRQAALSRQRSPQRHIARAQMLAVHRRGTAAGLKARFSPEPGISVNSAMACVVALTAAARR